MNKTMALLTLMSQCSQCEEGKELADDTDPPADTDVGDTDGEDAECPPDVVSVRFDGEEAGVFDCPTAYIAVSAMVGTERPCHCSAETVTISQPFGGPPSNWDFRILPDQGAWYASLCVPVAFWEEIEQDFTDVYFLCYWSR